MVPRRHVGLLHSSRHHREEGDNDGPVRLLGSLQHAPGQNGARGWRCLGRQLQRTRQVRHQENRPGPSSSEDLIFLINETEYFDFVFLRR